jgi:hypothetical protein
MPRRVTMVAHHPHVAPRHPFLWPTGGNGRTSLTYRARHGASSVGQVWLSAMVKLGGRSRSAVVEPPLLRMASRWVPNDRSFPGQARKGVRAAPAGALL